MLGCVVILGVHALLAWSLCSRSLPVGHGDASRYYVLAQGLASEGTYPVRTVPPGFSLTLVPWIRLLGPYPASLKPIRSQNVAWAVLGLVLGFVYARRVLGLGNGPALGCLAATALAPPAIGLSGDTMSESLFVLLFWAILLLAHVGARHAWAAIPVGALLLAVFWVRTIACCLFPALVASSLYRGGRAILLATVVSGGVAIAWWAAWVASDADGRQTYVKELFATRGAYTPHAQVSIVPLLENLRVQSRSILTSDLPEVCFPILGSQTLQSWLDARVRTVLFLVVSLGLCWLLVRGGRRALASAPVLVAGVFLYICIVLVWWFEAKRFLVAVLQPLWLLIAAGLDRNPRVLAAVLGLSIAGSLVSDSRSIHRMWTTGHPAGSVAAVDDQDAAAACAWLARNARPDDLLVTNGDPWRVRLVCGRDVRRLDGASLPRVPDGQVRWVLLSTESGGAAALDGRSSRRVWSAPAGRWAVFRCPGP